MSAQMADVPEVLCRPVHLRRIECTGFAREDGLFDIEGRLTDTRPEPLALAERTVPAHAPIHRMRRGEWEWAPVLDPFLTRSPEWSRRGVGRRKDDEGLGRRRDEGLVRRRDEGLVR